MLRSESAALVADVAVFAGVGGGVHRGQQLLRCEGLLQKASPGTSGRGPPGSTAPPDMTNTRSPGCEARALCASAIPCMPAIRLSVSSTW